MREKIIEEIHSSKVIAIARGLDPRKAVQLAEALYNGGIRLVEVTFNQRDTKNKFEKTCTAIEAIRSAMGGKMYVGAGTVLTIEQLTLAKQAGAQFIVSPDMNPEVIQETRRLGLVSLPGALSPSEIVQAHAAGADFVKVFPAGKLGAGYIKAVCAPISHIPLLAVGGIDEKNIAEFIAAGAAGAGVGGNLANKQWIDEGAFEKITATASALIKNCGK